MGKLSSYKVPSLSQHLKIEILYKMIFFHYLITWKDYDALHINFSLYTHTQILLLLHYFQKILLFNLFLSVKLMFPELSEKK